MVKQQTMNVRNPGPELYTITVSGWSATVDGFALSADNELYFLSMLGAHTSLKAIWAGLLKHPPARAWLQPGILGVDSDEGGGTGLGEYRECYVPYETWGTWTTRLTRLPSTRGWHAMAYTRLGEYDNSKESFLLLPRDSDNERELYYRYLNRRMTLPMLPEWADYLWKWGEQVEEIETLESIGTRAYWCTPSKELLQLAISDGIAHGQLEIPKSQKEVLV